MGLSYLFALPPAIFAEFYLRTQLLAFNNVAQKACNIMDLPWLLVFGVNEQRWKEQAKAAGQ